MENEIKNEMETEQPKKKNGRHLTPAEQLERIAAQQKELAARARAIRAKEDAKVRKARAHRLIQVGAVAEAVYGAPIAGADMLARFETFLRARQDELIRALSAGTDAETI
ncbi:MAG: hypothetical protein IKX77_03175 [Clostridia bacterium]|nr:hypothetical protein [Schwartzia sp. (in: firmicutes)]MBR4979532.1 hypothetical protein [Clostridia bacterium]